MCPPQSGWVKTATTTMATTTKRSETFFLIITAFPTLEVLCIQCPNAVEKHIIVVFLVMYPGCEREAGSSMWIYVLLGNLLRGIGETPIQPLGITYIDDYAIEEDAALYIGRVNRSLFCFVFLNAFFPRGSRVILANGMSVVELTCPDCFACIISNIKVYLTIMYTQGTKFPFNHTSTVPLS